MESNTGAAQEGRPTAEELLAYLQTNVLFETFSEPILQTLVNDMEWARLQEGECLFRQGETGGFLCLVYQGCLEVIITRKDGVDITVAQVGPGKPLGEIQFLSGGTRTASVYALQPSELLKLSRSAFDRLSAKKPEILHHMAEIIRQRLRRDQLITMLPLLCGPVDPDMLKAIETETEWIWLPQGEALFHENDVGDSFFLLISGRLYAAVHDKTDREQIVGEIKRGEIVGEMSMFTGENRSASVYAARNSELVKFSRQAFERIIALYPKMMMQMAQIVIKRLQQSQSPSYAPTPVMNVAIVATSPDTPLREFSKRAVAALSGHGSTLHLHSDRLEQLLDMPGIAQTPEYAPNNVRLAAWLDEQETKHRIVVYETDMSPSPWTRRCIQRADRVLLVAKSVSSPETGEIERALLGSGKNIPRMRRSLILLHPNGTQLPAGTHRWLEQRHVDEHHHLRWDTETDFQRLARFLTGNAIGLVLSGGGARGCAHIGVIRALAEAGFPIDMIGGTSIGAAIAALYAMGREYDEMLRINRHIWIDSKPFSDYTLPIMSLIKGKKFEHIAQSVYGETPIEDLWVNYFCVSTNLTTTEVVAHREGPLWKALRATASLPGIAVPLIKENHLLVDGGVLNNLPVDIMRELCGGLVIAVNVSFEKDLTVDYAQFPSPWKIIWDRLLASHKARNVPNILDILLRATMVGSIHQTNAVKDVVDLYLQPPVSRFKLLDFKALKEIADVGYEYTKKRLDEWDPSHQ